MGESRLRRPAQDLAARRSECGGTARLTAANVIILNMSVRRFSPRLNSSRGVAQPGRAPGSGPGGRRFKSSLPDQFFPVRSGDMGNRTFRRHRLHFWPEGVLQGLQSFFLQINMAEIVIHKTDQPDAVVDFFDTDGLSGKGNAEVDLLVVQAKTSAAGDHDGAVVKWVMGLRDASIRAGRGGVNLGRALIGFCMTCTGGYLLANQVSVVGSY